MAAKSKKGGLVVVSFGTMIKVGTMDQEIFDCLLAAFKHFKDYVFFWKVDNVRKGVHVQRDAVTKHRLEQMNAAGNILHTDWIPQMDLLGMCVSHLLLGGLSKSPVSKYRMGGGIPYS
jgi:hypothetical protein